MRSLHALKMEAAKTMIRRGHRLRYWVNEGPDKRRSTRAHTSCPDCDREAQVNTRPMPNEIDIGGEAVALNCG